MIEPFFPWVPKSQPSPNGSSAMALMLPWQSRQKLHFPWQQRSNGGEAMVASSAWEHQLWG